MLDRKNFKNFIDDVVVTYKETTPKRDLRVDPFGNFEVIFVDISNDSYARSKNIHYYGNGLGSLLFDKETNLHKFIKSINDVELNSFSKNIEIPGALYTIHRLMPMSQPNTLSMSWLNTKTPFIERVFVPWMKANSINGTFPLVKCDLKITFPLLAPSQVQEAQIVYTYYGVKPIEVGLHKMTNEPLQDFYRKVSFGFDYFMVNSEK